MSCGAVGSVATAAWQHTLARGTGPAILPPVRDPACRSLVADTRRARVSAAAMATRTRSVLAEPRISSPARAAWARAQGRQLARMAHHDPDTGDNSPASEPDARDYADPADWAGAMERWVERSSLRGWVTGVGPGPDCERMEPPASELQGFCGWAYRGSTTECGEPCMDAKGLDDFLAIDPEDYREYVTFRDEPRSFTADEQRLLLRAWGVVLENWDLVEWALCMAIGDRPAKLDCYARHFYNLHGQGRVDFAMIRNAQYHNCQDIDTLAEWDASGGEIGAAATAAWGATGGRIRFCDNVLWRGLRVAACSGYAPALASATFGVAMLLVHEMAHICSLGADPDEATTCYSSYAIGGAFAYALGTRYRAIVSDPAVACTAGLRYAENLALMWGDQLQKLAFPVFLDQVDGPVFCSHDDYAAGVPGCSLSDTELAGLLESPCD